MNQKKQIQKVIFAGAGPGDPELITLKTVRHLEGSGSDHHRSSGK